MAKYAAFGATLTIDAVATVQIEEIDGPDLTLETIDVTTHDSTGGWREFIAGLKDAGEVGLTLVFDPATATHRNSSGGLLHKLINRTTGAFVLTLPSSPTVQWSFTAFVTSFQVQAAVADKLPANVTLKITGAPTIPA